MRDHRACNLQKIRAAMKAAIISLAAEARNLNLDAHDISVIGAAAVRFAVLVELELGLVSKNQVQRAKTYWSCFRMVAKTRKGCRDLVWQIQHQHCKPSSGILRALWRNELCVRQPDWNLAEPRVDRLFTNSCVSIDAQDVPRANRSRSTPQDGAHGRSTCLPGKCGRPVVFHLAAHI